MAAPCNHGRLPAPSEFSAVRFHDISRTGISFKMRVPPSFSRVVLRLGHPPGHVCVLAEVVRSTPFDEEMTEFLVGCRFLKKVEISGFA